MLDLESLSTRPGGVILVIAAIKFKRHEIWDEKMDIEKIDKFYRRIDIESCIDTGLTVESDTVKWWNNQNKDIKYEALNNPDRIPLKKALQEFSNWFGNNQRTLIWGNGSSFDCGILGEAYKRCGMAIPWKFWLERDLRTIMDIGGIRACDLPQYKKHHALFDCYRQIIGFQRSMKNIKKGI